MSPFIRQTWAVSGVLLNMMAQGMVLSYPSSLLPGLRAPDSSIKVDLKTGSWIASSVGIGGIPGILISSFLMERFGRRIAHALIILPGCTGWALIYFAKDVTALIVGRLLCGLTAGGTVSLGAVVIGEYSSPKNRGMFLNLKTASVCLGGMIIHILGNFFAWRTVALLALAPHFVALMIIATWPESPAWLASKGEFKKSEDSFLWLRGKDEQSVRELDDMIKAQMNQASKTEHWTLKAKTVEFFKKLTRKDFVKPVIVILLGGMLLEVSGRHIFPAYALDIMGEITGNKAQSFYFTLALDIIITSSALFSSVLVKIMNRRTLLFGTGFPCVMVLLTVCTYLFLASRDVISKDYNWFPIALFVLYFILVNLACTPVPLAFLGEMLPLAHRGAGSAIGGIAMSLFLNAGLQMTPYLLVNCKVYGTFAVLGCMMAVLLFILYFVLPETKDRTLQEIEYFFNEGKFREEEVKYDDEEAKEKMMKNHDVA